MRVRVALSLIIFLVRLCDDDNKTTYEISVKMADYKTYLATNILSEDKTVCLLPNSCKFQLSNKIYR